MSSNICLLLEPYKEEEASLMAPETILQAARAYVFEECHEFSGTGDGDHVTCTCFLRLAPLVSYIIFQVMVTTFGWSVRTFLVWHFAILTRKALQKPRSSGAWRLFLVFCTCIFLYRVDAELRNMTGGGHMLLEWGLIGTLRWVRDLFHIREVRTQRKYLCKNGYNIHIGRSYRQQE